jgi:3-dehydroquinate synthetase
MKPTILMLTTLLSAGGAYAVVSGQQAGAQHEQHGQAASSGMHDMSAMMARMHANDARLDQLVKKMQTTTGAAKTEAVAELLAALVEDRKNTCEPMMAHMMSMMSGSGQMDHAAPKK